MCGNPFKKVGGQGTQLNYFTADPSKLWDRAKEKARGNFFKDYSTAGINPALAALGPTEEEYSNFNAEEATKEKAAFDLATAPEREAAAKEQAAKDSILAKNRRNMGRGKTAKDEDLKLSRKTLLG